MLDPNVVFPFVYLAFVALHVLFAVAFFYASRRTVTALRGHALYVQLFIVVSTMLAAYQAIWRLVEVILALAKKDFVSEPIDFDALVEEILAELASLPPIPTITPTVKPGKMIPVMWMTVPAELPSLVKGFHVLNVTSIFDAAGPISLPSTLTPFLFLVLAFLLVAWSHSIVIHWPADASSRLTRLQTNITRWMQSPTPLVRLWPMSSTANIPPVQDELRVRVFSLSLNPPCPLTPPQPSYSAEITLPSATCIKGTLDPTAGLDHEPEIQVRIYSLMSCLALCTNAFL